MSENPETIKFETMPIIIRIPADAARIELKATMFDENGDLIHVGRTLSITDIIQSRQDFLDNVELGDDYDAVYTLTDEGRALADALFGEEE